MSKIVGDFKLTEKIGRGSYADVYKGEHMKTGHIFAVKKIMKSNLTNPKLIAGLENEIKIMREFNHPNIVRLEDSFSSERNFYLVLEMCSLDLAKFIRTRVRLEERLACNFLAQILDGLKFLNDKSYVHRDLKPANCLLSENSDQAVLKLADFGYARYLEGASLAMTSCGTPLYMAPEILEARSYDSRADVWSVGCIFFEMLTGIPPYNGTSQGDLLNNIKTKELNVPKGVSISRPSIDILIKVLERDSSRRATTEQLFLMTRSFIPIPVPPSDDGFTASTTDASFTSGSNRKLSAENGGVGGERELVATHNMNSLNSPPPPGVNRKVSSATATAALMMGGGGKNGGTVPLLNVSPGTSGQGGVAGPSISPRDAVTSTTGISRAPNRRHSSSEDNIGIGAPRQQNAGGTPPEFSHVSKNARQQASGTFLNSADDMPQKPNHPIKSSSSSPQNNNGFLPGEQHPNHGKDSLGSGADSNGYDTLYHRNNEDGRGATAHKQRCVSVDSGGTAAAQNSSTGTAFTTAGNFNFHNRPMADSNQGNTDVDRFTSTYLTQQQQQRLYKDDVALKRGDGDSGGGGGKTAIPVDLLDDYVVVGLTDSSSSGPGGGSSDRPYYNHSNQQDRQNQQSQQQQQPPPQQQQQQQNAAGPDDELYIDAHDHDLLTNIVKRCEQYMKVVRDVTMLGDEFVYAAMHCGTGSDKSNSSMDSGIVSHNYDLPSVTPVQLVELFSKGSILYIHALSIIRRCVLPSFDLLQQQQDDISSGIKQQVVGGVSKGYEMVLCDVRDDVQASYTQLLRRSECGQEEMQKILLKNTSCGSNNTAALVGGNMPVVCVQTAEQLMLQAAERNESIAGNEELLGRLVGACKLYESSKDLVDASILTVLDQEQRRRLEQYSKQLLAKYIDCKSRADDLFLFNN